MMKYMVSACLAIICAAAYAQTAVTGERTLTFYFKYNSHEIDSSQTRTSSDLRKWLASVEIVSARIEGNTDLTGSEKYNYDLGMKRAQSVEDFLKGFSPDAYVTKVISNGEEKPLSMDDSEISLAQNRRVDVTLSYRIKEAIVSETEYEMDRDTSTVGQTLVGKHGTRVILPGNLFYPNTLNQVNLFINEAVTPCDIFNQRLNTISVDNECLQTAGMIFLKAYVDGVEVQPVEGMQIEIQIPANLVDPEMKLYESSNDRWSLSEFKLVPREIDGEMFYTFKTKWKSGWNIDKVVGPCLDAGPVVRVTYGEVKYMQLYSTSNTYLNAVPLKKGKLRFPTYRDVQTASVYIRVARGDNEYEFKGILADLRYSARKKVYVVRKQDMHRLNHWEMVGRGSPFFVDCN